MSEQLKPCPWNCGKPSQITKMVTLRRWSFLHRCPIVGPISFTCATEEGCALEWNTRPTHDAQVDSQTLENVVALTREVRRLGQQVERYEKPISDEEWQRNYGYGGKPGTRPETADRTDVDRIIASRKAAMNGPITAPTESTAAQSKAGGAE